MVEKLKCSFDRFTKMIFVFSRSEYLRIHNKNSTRPKKGEIFRTILRIFFNLLLEDHATVFFIYVFLFTHCEERNPMGGELFCKKEEEEH